MRFVTFVVNELPVAEVEILAVKKTAVYSYSSGTIDGLADIQVKVGDAAATTMPMVFTTIGGISGLYKAVAQYSGNYYATYQDALNARKSAGVPGDIIALDASAPLPAGYSITDGKLVRTLKPMVILF